MGGQKGIALFYRYLAQQVQLTCVGVEANRANESFRVFNTLPNSRSRYINPLFFFSFRKQALENESTHLLFEHPYFAWLILLMRWTTSHRIIVHAHNIESERFRSVGKWWWKILWYYERMAYRTADMVWFKTDEDKRYAIEKFRLKASQCVTIPYGVAQDALPEMEETRKAKQWVCATHSIDPNDRILLFNGTLNYKPNLDALQCILDEINPVLRRQHAHYKIIVCGKGLPDEMQQLKSYAGANIIYAGFVDDIDLYFKACDLFLNPLVDGGGIKTKLVEALGFGKPAVSFANGAIGVDAAVCGDRLRVVADRDVHAFTDAVGELLAFPLQNNHAAYYAVYSWRAIAEKAAHSIQ